MTIHRQVSFESSADSPYTITGNAAVAPSAGQQGTSKGLRVDATAGTGYAVIPSSTPQSIGIGSISTWLRFYVDTTGVTATPTNYSDICRWANDYLRLMINGASNSLYITGTGLSFFDTGADLTGKHLIEVELQASSASGVTDGEVRVFVDSVQVHEQLAKDFGYGWTGSEWHLGLVRNTGIQGVVNVDEFVFGSTRAGAYAAPVKLSDDLTRVSAMLKGNTRVTILGDSIAVSSEQKRFFWGFLRGIKHDNLVAIQQGYQTGGDSAIIASELFTGGVKDRVGALETNLFEVEQALAPATHFYALPCNRITEWQATAGSGGTGADRELLTVTYSPLPFLASATKTPFVDGDRVAARQLIRAPISDPTKLYQQLRTKEAGSPAAWQSHALQVDGCRPKLSLGGDPIGASVGTTAVAGEINALFPDVVMTGNGSAASGDFSYTVADGATTRLGTDDWISFAGSVYYRVEADGRTPVKGLYVSCLADSSFDLNAIYDNTSASSASNKRFTDDQLAHWLDATTTDPDQEQLVILHYAYETAPTKANYEAAFANIREAFRKVGLKEPHILINFSPWVSFTTSLANDKISASTSRSTLLTASNPDKNVSFADVYGLSGENQFTDDDRYTGQGIEANNVQWLTDNGYYPSFVYGSISADFSSATYAGQNEGGRLSDDIHPIDEHAAAFFAKLLGDRIDRYERAVDVDLSALPDTAALAAVQTAILADASIKFGSLDSQADTNNALVLAAVAAADANSGAMLSQTITGNGGTLTYTLDDGPSADDAINGHLAIITGATTRVATVADYQASGNEIDFVESGLSILQGDKVRIYPTDKTTADATLTEATAAKVAAQAGGGGGPIEQSEIGDRYIVKLSGRDDNIATGNTPWRLKPGETRTVAIDPSALTDGGRLYGMGQPVSGDTAVTTVSATYGADRELAKLRLSVPSGATVGATTTITADLNPISGDVIKAVVTVEVL